MNKIKLLAPIIGLTALTGAIAPMVSCTKDKDKVVIELNKFFMLSWDESNSSTVIGLMTEEGYNIEANKTYSVYVDLQKISDAYPGYTIDILYEDADFVFKTSDGAETFEEFQQAKGLEIATDKTSASSSGNSLQKVESDDDVEPGKYSFYNQDDNWRVYFGCENFNKTNPIFEIDVTFTQPADDQYFYFYFG